MIGKVIKIAIALLVLNGVVRVGAAYWANYRFEDQLSEIAQFGDRRGEALLCGAALEAAQKLGLPVAAEAIQIRRGTNPPFTCGKGYEGAVPANRGGAQKLAIEAAYQRNLDVFPGYTRRFTFNPSAEVWARVY
ncbi:MAG: hypothetical protein H6Q10_75 [Acidobacteria bacterium]|nr:hypothetical protein [Acidobacteriota bacterium]